jgi:thiosulfate reductase cytochrome b subunit
LTGNRTRHLKIGIKDLMGISAQAKYYLIYIFGGGENPFRASADNKYNPLQKIAYNAVMFILLPVQALTVFAFTDIPALRHSVHSADLIALLGAIHILIMYLLVLYLIFHLYMATLGETFFSHTKAMIKGYEEHHQEIEREPT